MRFQEVSSALQSFRCQENQASTTPVQLNDSFIVSFPPVSISNVNQFQSPLHLNTIAETVSDHEVDSLCSELDNVSVTDKLRKWVVKHNIRHVALKDLLSILHDRIPELAYKDPRSFMKTKRQVNIENVSSGKFAYFGIETGLISRIQDGLKKELVSVSMTVGVDGIPVSKSSNNQFWPILGIINESINDKPFVIGLYYGSKKPSNSNFLLKFVEDCMRLKADGVCVNNVKFSFSVSKFCADAPARSFLKAIKSHNSYFGCERCNVEGEWLGRVIFPIDNSNVRTNETFRNKTHPEHHIGDSVLLQLGIDMIRQFPLDYLHLMCLGVGRKTIRTWVKGRVPLKLRSSDIETINQNVQVVKKYFPSDFQRKPRSFNEIEYFKGTEYRTIILYTGIVLFRNVLCKERFEHFVLLHSAMFILLSKFANNTWWNDLAKKILKKFVETTASVYGSEFLTYNFHSCLHLPDDAMYHGSIEDCSTFRFENFMQVLKRMIHCNSFCLEQVVHRLLESEFIDSSANRQLEKKIKLSCKLGDNCYMLKNGNVVVLRKRLNELESTFEVLRYLSKHDCLLYPFKSSDLGIYIVKDPVIENVKVDINNVVCKYIRLPYKENFHCLPLLHTIL